MWIREEEGKSQGRVWQREKQNQKLEVAKAESSRFLGREPVTEAGVF